MNNKYIGIVGQGKQSRNILSQALKFEEDVTKLSILYETEHSLIKEEILKMARESFMPIEEAVLRYSSLRNLAESSNEKEDK